MRTPRKGLQQGPNLQHHQAVSLVKSPANQAQLTVILCSKYLPQHQSMATAVINQIQATLPGVQVGSTSDFSGIPHSTPTSRNLVGTKTPDWLPGLLTQTDSSPTPMLLTAQAPSNAIPHRQEWHTSLPVPAHMGTHMGSTPGHLAALDKLFRLCSTIPCKFCPLPLQDQYHIHQILWSNANFLSNYTLYQWLLALEQLCQNTAWDRWWYH